MKRRALQFGSVGGAASAALGSAAASICCIGPIGIAILGVNGASFAAGLKPYRWYLLGGSLLMLGLAYWMVYRPPTAIAGAACSTRFARWSKIVLWSASGVWIAAFALQFLADRLWY